MTEAKKPFWQRFDWNPLPLFLLLMTAAGLAITYVDANLSFQFGETVDPLVAWGLWALAIGSGVLPVVAVMFWRQGHFRFAQFIGAAAVGLFLVNVASNMPIATASRVVEAESAGLQKAKFVQRDTRKAQAEANIKTFTARKQMLLGKLDKMVSKKVGDWEVTFAPTSVAAVDKMIAEKESERSREASRGCARPPCKGPEYEKRSREIQHLLAIRGLANDIEKVERQIDGSQRVVDSALATLETAGGEDVGINQTAAASEFVARWTFGWLSSESKNQKSGLGVKTERVRTANEALGMIMAVGLALGGIALNLAGAFPHLMKISPQSNVPQTGARSFPLPGNTSPQSVAPGAPNRTEVTVVEREQPQVMVTHMPFAEWRAKYEGQGAVVGSAA